MFVLNTSKGKTTSQQITSNDTLVLTCSHLLTQCYLTENYTLALAVTFAPTLSLKIILAIAQKYDHENMLKAWLADLTIAPGVSTIYHLA